MTKKNIVITVVVGVVLLVAGFFGGIKYGQSAKALAGLSQTKKQEVMVALRGNGNTPTGNGAQTGTNGTPGGFGTPPSGGFTGGTGTPSGRMGSQGGGVTDGQIIAKDDKSITIKMTDNSTKIVFYSGSTTIGKTDAASAADLTVGEQVLATGTANSNGSVAAQNIQIRPATQQNPQQ